MTKRHLVIATRQSPLALSQAETVKAMLVKEHPELRVEFLKIVTEADRMLNKKVIEFGGKGVFVKELEEALFDERADIAVHSMKDVPMELPPGLSMPVLTKRVDPRDAFVSTKYSSIMSMPANARIGTSSLRRQTQILSERPDLELVDIRGNLQTRLKKLEENQVDALILASAGLIRMSLQSYIKSYIDADDILPAAGQGALGIQCREGDTATIKLIESLNDGITRTCVTAERAMCQRLGGGCHVPVAAYAQVRRDQLVLKGLVAAPRGKTVLHAEKLGPLLSPEALGLAVAEELAAKGADDILKEYH